MWLECTWCRNYDFPTGKYKIFRRTWMHSNSLIMKYRSVCLSHDVPNLLLLSVFWFCSGSVFYDSGFLLFTLFDDRLTFLLIFFTLPLYDILDLSAYLLSNKVHFATASASTARQCFIIDVSLNTANKTNSQSKCVRTFYSNELHLESEAKCTLGWIRGKETCICSMKCCISCANSFSHFTAPHSRKHLCAHN